jgi:hypothetical protein
MSDEDAQRLDSYSRTGIISREASRRINLCLIPYLCVSVWAEGVPPSR